MNPSTRAALNEMWDLHAEREKRHSALDAPRLELHEMRRQILLAETPEEARHIAAQRKALKREYLDAHKPLVVIDRRLKELALSIPGNYVMKAKPGKFGMSIPVIERVPEAIMNWRGWARRISFRQSWQG